MSKDRQDEVLARFLCGGKPDTQEEAAALERAIRLAPWGVSIEADRRRPSRFAGWFKWLRLATQR